jgi:hypothetical protein
MLHLSPALRADYGFTLGSFLLGGFRPQNVFHHPGL